MQKASPPPAAVCRARDPSNCMLKCSGVFETWGRLAEQGAGIHLGGCCISASLFATHIFLKKGHEQNIVLLSTEHVSQV